MRLHFVTTQITRRQQRGSSEQCWIWIWRVINDENVIMWLCFREKIEIIEKHWFHSQILCCINSVWNWIVCVYGEGSVGNHCSLWNNKENVPFRCVSVRNKRCVQCWSQLQSSCETSRCQNVTLFNYSAPARGYSGVLNCGPICNSTIICILSFCFISALCNQIMTEVSPKQQHFKQFWCNVTFLSQFIILFHHVFANIRPICVQNRRSKLIG